MSRPDSTRVRSRGLPRSRLHTAAIVSPRRIRGRGPTVGREMRTDAPPAGDTRRALPPPTRGVLVEEVLIVLSLSLLASAAYAILDLLAAPVNRSVAVVTFSTSPQVA